MFDYLPLNAYTASLPATLAHSRLAGLGLRSIAPMPGRWKLAGALAQGMVPTHARRGGTRLKVVLTYYPALTPAQAVAALSSAEFQVVRQDDFAHQLHVVLAEAAPLPFAGQLRVAVAAAPAGAATLQLLDAPGREVRRLPLTLRSSAQQIEFDTENLPAGVYVLYLNSASGIWQLKVLK